MSYIQNYSSLYKVIAEEAVMGFVTFDEETRQCEFANKMAHQLLELPFEFDIKNLKLDQILATHKKTDNKIKPLNEEILQFEGFFQDIMVSKLNGRLFIANVGIKRVQMENSTHLLLMFQDMTIQKKLQKDISAKQAEIKSAYEELLEQNKQLKELDVAKNRFIALTTHELRTPLSAMVATSEILKLKLYDNEEQLDEFINMIYDEGHHLLELVNDILDFSKIQAGKMDFYVEQHGLNDLVHCTVDTLQSMAETDNIKLNFNEPEFDCTCWYDDVRLKQVVSNILNNAIKYNKPNGKVEIWLENTNDDLILYVRDTGKGIPPEHLAQVFNEFETLGKVALHSKGTGLGMPISKRLIESMGGNIHLTSEVGVGTTFWINVPKHKVLGEELYRSRPDENFDLVA